MAAPRKKTFRRKTTPPSQKRVEKPKAKKEAEVTIIEPSASSASQTQQVSQPLQEIGSDVEKPSVSQEVTPVSGIPTGTVEPVSQATPPQDTISPHPQESTTLAEPVISPAAPSTSITSPTQESSSEGSSASSDTIVSDQPIMPEEAGRKKWILIFFGIVLLTIIVASAGLFIYRNNFMKPAEPKAKDIKQKTQKPTPSPTPQAVSLTEFSVQVLNGSGIAGVAAVVADLLEQEKFESVDTGNADSYDFVKTQVQLKPKTPKAVYEAILKALEDNYIVTRSADLIKDAEFDVVITVGKGKPQ